MKRWALLAATVALAGCASTTAGSGPTSAPGTSPSADASYFPTTNPSVFPSTEADACQVWMSDLSTTFSRATFLNDATPLIRASSGLAPNIDGNSNANPNAPWYGLSAWAGAHPADPVAVAWMALDTAFLQSSDTNLTAVSTAAENMSSACL